MNANFLAATARPLLLAAALCLAPTAQAEDSKHCNWPNGNAEGLICLADQSTPLLPNGTTRDKPAKICSHGPGGEALYYGCHELWYDQPGGSELLPVPWKQEDFIPFLAYLDSVAGNAGEESGWCYADQPPPYKQETGREEATDDQGKPVVEVLYKCEGFTESCDAGPANECEPGEEFVVAEPPPCDPHTWSPDPSTVERGKRFVATNGCGRDEELRGQKVVHRWIPCYRKLDICDGGTDRTVRDGRGCIIYKSCK